MGTRNITRVICDGDVKVNQYCQWDGYPTGRGEEVMLFMRDVLTNGDYKKFETAIQKSTLIHNSDDEVEAFYTGAPFLPSIFDKLGEENMYSEMQNRIEKCLNKQKIYLSEANFMMVASRDTGNEVLPYMMMHSPSGMLFYTTKYLDEITEELDWQIEGMYVINLDNETVTIIYHEKFRRYTFEELANMDDDQIEEEMKTLEKSDEEE